MNNINVNFVHHQERWFSERLPTSRALGLDLRSGNAKMKEWRGSGA
jgi:hypothetical protein